MCDLKLKFLEEQTVIFLVIPSAPRSIAAYKFPILPTLLPVVRTVRSLVMKISEIVQFH